MDKFEVSLAEMLGIDNEYDIFNKQAKVCLAIITGTDPEQ